MTIADDVAPLDATAQSELVRRGELTVVEVSSPRPFGAERPNG